MEKKLTRQGEYYQERYRRKGELKKITPEDAIEIFKRYLQMIAVGVMSPYTQLHDEFPQYSRSQISNYIQRRLSKIKNRV